MVPMFRNFVHIKWMNLNSQRVLTRLGRQKYTYKKCTLKKSVLILLAVRFIIEPYIKAVAQLLAALLRNRNNVSDNMKNQTKLKYKPINLNANGRATA